MTNKACWRFAEAAKKARALARAVEMWVGRAIRKWPSDSVGPDRITEGFSILAVLPLYRVSVSAI